MIWRPAVPQSCALKRARSTRGSARSRWPAPRDDRVHATRLTHVDHAIGHATFAPRCHVQPRGAAPAASRDPRHLRAHLPAELAAALVGGRDEGVGHHRPLRLRLRPRQLRLPHAQTRLPHERVATARRRHDVGVRLDRPALDARRRGGGGRGGRRREVAAWAARQERVARPLRLPLR
eukprot:6582447-Prymnesium_polylepis.1